jgi:hypothetical protein
MEMAIIISNFILSPFSRPFWLAMTVFYHTSDDFPSVNLA